MKAIVTVLGKDTTGIMAKVCNLLADKECNILDISQTVMQGYFTMTMLIDHEKSNDNFAQIADDLNTLGENNALSIRMQSEDIFNLMHKI